MYKTVKDIQCTRKHIQRKHIFSKPVRGYSIESLSKNKTLERLDTYTDNSRYISSIDIIDDWVVNLLSESGYIRFSDIYLVDKERLAKDIDLPDNAIDELYDMAVKDSEINFEGDNTIVETIQRNDAIDTLIGIGWDRLVLFEYTMLCWIKNKTEEIYEQENFNSKYNLIKLFVENLEEPRNNISAISYCTNSSEDYIKNIISGRIEKNLTKSERKEILDRDDNKCRICGNKDNLEVHHVIPVANGGGKYSKNLCTLCSSCHFNIAHNKDTYTISYSNQSEFWEEVIGDSPPE